MPHEPIRTTVIGSYPFPGWLELVGDHLDELGPDDVEEAIRDAVSAAIGEQLRAGVDLITDGEQTRFDFNLSFYAFLDGLELDREPRRRFGPPAHDQRGRHQIVGELAAPNGLGVLEEWERLRTLAPTGAGLKASVPGPYTLSGRLAPNERYEDDLREAQRQAIEDRAGLWEACACPPRFGGWPTRSNVVRELRPAADRLTPPRRPTPPAKAFVPCTG